MVDRVLRTRCYSSAASRRKFLTPVRAALAFSEKSVHLLSILSLSILCSAVSAQNVDRISKREIERRQAALPRGAEVLARAQAAMRARNYAVAHEEFRSALELLPDAVTSGKAHDEALTGFCESGVKVAEQRIADGSCSPTCSSPVTSTKRWAQHSSKKLKR